jgi:signal transduction histidine kinase
MKPDILQQFSSYPSKLLPSDSAPRDGVILGVNNYCEKKFKSGDKCSNFYSWVASQPDGYHRCPFGFSAYKTSAAGIPLALTSLVPLPRDNKARDAAEDQRLKDHPNSGVTRESIEKLAQAFHLMKVGYLELEKQALQKLPHALHEIRKLNAAIKAESEALTNATGDGRCLTILRASEFMSTQFEFLDLLINESIAQLPIKDKGQLDSLVYKCLKIFETKAEEKRLTLEFNNRQPVWVDCCDKTLPIVITVLLDNAIRYSPDKGMIGIEVKKTGNKVTLRVENSGEMKLPPERRFIKNERGAHNIEGSGFGLYFAKKIAEQHRGTLTCESGAGKVAFIFELAARDTR